MTCRFALQTQTNELFHFAGNAFLRTYQLLVSPSVVSYLIREQFYHFPPCQRSIEDSFPKKMEYTLYMLSIKEWNLDSYTYRYLWNPAKAMGNKLDFVTLNQLFGQASKNRLCISTVLFGAFRFSDYAYVCWRGFDF